MPKQQKNGIRPIVGQGELAELIRGHDWAASPLGPIETWPDNLICSVNLMLACAFPCLVFWGPQLVQFYNDSFRPLIAEKHPASLGQTARVCWEEAWDIIGPQMDLVLRQGKTVSHERVLVPILRHGGLSDVYWNYSYSPLFEPDGQIAGILVVCQDVTQELLANSSLKASEDALRRGEERLRLALAAAEGVGVYDWDIVNDRVYSDEAFARLYGVDPKNASSGAPIAEYFRYVHPDDLQRLEGEIRVALREACEFSSEYRLIQKDGSVRSVLAVGRCTYAADGSPVRLAGLTIDITQRKQTEQALRESEARLQSIYHTSLEYIGILSPEGKVLDCNRASLEFAGNRREDVIGKNFWETPWFIHTPGMAEAVREGIARAAMGETMRTEMTLTRPTGDALTFDFSLTPIFDARGNVIFLLPEGRDISVLKLAERALLENEKIAAVGRLASSIAHEINNPLEAVTNLLYLARQRENVPELQNFLDAADHELRRVSVIANQTLRFHKQASSPRAVHPEELFSTVLSIYEGKLKNLNITIEELHRGHQPVVCFEGDVRQVLNNLVGNAIDAMKGGGRLLIRSHAATDWATGRKGLVLTVADSGCGMSPATLKRVFEPFFTTKGIAGTGLGLWISKEVAERHGGVLRARSCQRPSRAGTVFRFFLPFAQSKTPSAET